MVKLLLHRGNTAGILTFDNVCESFGRSDGFFISYHSVFDNVYCDSGINVADDVEAYGNIGINFEINKLLIFVFIGLCVACFIIGKNQANVSLLLKKLMRELLQICLCVSYI